MGEIVVKVSARCQRFRQVEIAAVQNVLRPAAVREEHLALTGQVFVDPERHLRDNVRRVTGGIQVVLQKPWCSIRSGIPGAIRIRDITLYFLGYSA